MKDISKFLKSNKITKAEMDHMWDYCSSYPEYGGSLIKKLNDQGLRWSDLNEIAAVTLFDVFRKVEDNVINNIGKENEECN